MKNKRSKRTIEINIFYPYNKEQSVDNSFIMVYNSIIKLNKGAV